MIRPVRLAACLVALGLLAACTAPATMPIVSDSGYPVFPSASPIRTSAGPHHYRPGAVGVGDVLFPGEGNGGYDVTRYAIAIGYEPLGTMLTGDDVVTAIATRDLSRFDLDLHGLTVRSVSVNDVPAVFTRTGDELVVTPRRGIDVGTTFTAHVVYDGVPGGYRGLDLGTEGFLPSGGGALAQGEPDVAASWFPVNDHPSDKATYDIRVTVPSDLAALSNGVLSGRTSVGGRTTWHWVESAPMASYLAMVVIGRYRVVTGTHDGLPVVSAVDDALPMSVDAQLARTPEVLDFLVTCFGPYPFDALGGIVHNDGRFGFALENQTRPVYAAGFFTKPGDRSWVIAHELAHQWFGDSVSVRTWSDLWLNEGFATYAEWLWSWHRGQASPREIFDQVYYGRDGRELPLDPPAVPTARTMFGDSVYVRGAATLEALRITVGDVVFFRIVRGWARAKRYGNGSTADFVWFADQVSGMSLDRFLHAWLYERGVPPYPKRV